MKALLVVFLCCLMAIAWAILTRRKRRRHVRELLGGAVPDETLARFLRRPNDLVLEPSTRVITVMFLDIVGFSISAERLTPSQAFDDLQHLIAWLTKHIHEHGGVVDRVIGDGLVCFFGYSFDGKDGSRDHAERALSCAAVLQSLHFERCLEAARNEQPVYPLRIGLSTSGVYVRPSRLEPALIGSGVSYAKRLEGACDSFSIMLGASTRDMLRNPEARGLSLRKRYLQVKHMSELVEAYECDPVADRQEERKTLLAYHRNFARLDRKDPRWPVPPGEAIQAITSSGAGQLVNFSETGLAIQLGHYLSRGVSVSVALESSPPALRDRLNALGLLPLVCEVRWGTPIASDRCLLGLHIQNLSASQRRALMFELRRCLSERFALRA